MRPAPGRRVLNCPSSAVLDIPLTSSCLSNSCRFPIPSERIIDPPRSLWQAAITTEPKTRQTTSTPKGTHPSVVPPSRRPGPAANPARRRRAINQTLGIPDNPAYPLRWDRLFWQSCRRLDKNFTLSLCLVRACRSFRRTLPDCALCHHASFGAICSSIVAMAAQLTRD